MAVQDRTATALAYAWWLTGEPQAARRAADAAAASPRVAAAGYDERLPTLLREVRAAAPTSTMCPASELALLHDAHGLSLEVAARLIGLDLADARVELAHGRLEALAETVMDPFAHPERLGGLAVRNPADVAHARQCDSCEEAAQLIERGRGELLELATASMDVEAGPASGGADPDPAAPAGADRGSLPGLTEPNRRLVAFGLAAVMVIVVLLLAFGGGPGA